MSDLPPAPRPETPRKSGHGKLTWYIIAAIFAAIIVAILAPRIAMTFDVGGQIFARIGCYLIVWSIFEGVAACPLDWGARPYSS